MDIGQENKLTLTLLQVKVGLWEWYRKLTVRNLYQLLLRTSPLTLNTFPSHSPIHENQVEDILFMKYGFYITQTHLGVVWDKKFTYKCYSDLF